MPEPDSGGPLVPPGRTDTNTAAVLRAVRDRIAAGAALDPQGFARLVRETAAAVDWSETELRAALAPALGAGPDPDGAAARLGKAGCLERLDAAIDRLGDPENPILGQAGA